LIGDQETYFKFCNEYHPNENDTNDILKTFLITRVIIISALLITRVIIISALPISLQPFDALRP